MSVLRLPIPDSTGAKARELLKSGTVTLADTLEFMRGDVMCLRGTVRAFIRRREVEPCQNAPATVTSMADPPPASSVTIHYWKPSYARTPN